MNNPLISIIVPVYNAEKTLNRCVDSILQQTFTDWELLLINDGSKDSSGEICNEYARKDERIKVLHKENGGVSSARNVGLNNAEGEWIVFVDSDDWILEGFLENFYSRYLKYTFDLYVGNISVIDLSGEKNIGDSIDVKICSLRDAIVKYGINKLGDLHAKIFKKSILYQHCIQFNESIHYAEDGVFYAEYLSVIAKVTIDAYVCYIYEKRYTGLSFRMNSFYSEKLCFNLYYDIISILAKKNEIQFHSLFNVWIAFRYLYTLCVSSTLRSFEKELSSLDINKLQLVSESIKQKRLGTLVSKCIYVKQFKLAFVLLHFTFLKNGFRKIFSY